jgi:hypothetical protein
MEEEMPLHTVRCALAVALAIPGIAAAQSVEELKREIDAMKRRVETLERKLDEKEAGERPAVAAEKPPPPSAIDRALEEARAAAPAPPARPADPTAPVSGVPAPEPLLARRVGAANLRLIDVSFDVLTAAGWSTADDDELESLEGGAHDPNQRGFTLQQGELSLMGAVDPYFTAEGHIVFTPDGVELEEAFARTTALPYGLQVEAGHFFTEFGRINPLHPHAWDWMDQPVINSRLFGGDGLRNPGVRVGWLVPVPWFAELHLGAQNAKGETALSFLGDTGGGHAHEDEDEEDEEGGIGGRPPTDRSVDSLGDLLYLARLAQGFTLTDSLSAAVGVSALFGPNATGSDERTTIYGTDLVVKWRPARNFRGWPFLTWQTEAMQRDYQAASVPDMALPPTTLHDWGLYTQLLWGFRYGWAGGLRYEYAGGSGESVGGRNEDPFRDDRHRIAPLLVWQPSEYARLRLQYNYDQAQFLEAGDAHSVWVGLEVLYGAHPAHQY